MQIHMYTHRLLIVCTVAHIYPYTHIRAYIHIHTYIHTYKYIHTHTHIHKYTYTYTYILYIKKAIKKSYVQNGRPHPPYVRWKPGITCAYCPYDTIFTVQHSLHEAERGRPPKFLETLHPQGGKHKRSTAIYGHVN